MGIDEGAYAGTESSSSKSRNLWEPKDMPGASKDTRSELPLDRLDGLVKDVSFWALDCTEKSSCKNLKNAKDGD